MDSISYGLTEMAKLLSSHDQGSSLEPRTSKKMEDRLGNSLYQVRIHSSPAARAAVKLLGARAFTIGKNIYLNDNSLSTSSEGVLEHELIHTIQQQSWNGALLKLSSSTSAQEREAEQIVQSPIPRSFSANSASSAQPDTVMKVLPVVILAPILGELACLFGFYLYAFKKYGDRSDKFLHCWTSCKIATWCPPVPLAGQAIAALIGALKELADIVIGEAEVRDMKNNLSGIECSLHYRTSCWRCCNDKESRGILASAPSATEPKHMATSFAVP